jgi:hypothetical protein
MSWWQIWRDGGGVGRRRVRRSIARWCIEDSDRGGGRTNIEWRGCQGQGSHRTPPITIGPPPGWGPRWRGYVT